MFNGQFFPGQPLQFEGQQVAPPYTAEGLALCARFSTPPTTLRRRQIDTLIRALKAAGVWGKLDCLYVLAAADAQVAGLNWVQAAFNLAAVNSPAFTADRGYAGNGITSYLDTNFNPTTASSPHFLRNDVHIAHRSLTARAAANTPQEGHRGVTSNGVYILTRFAGDMCYARLHDTGGGVANTHSDGLFVGSRVVSTERVAYRNGSSLGTSAEASDINPINSNLFICGYNLGGSLSIGTTDQIALMSAGGGLTAAQVADYYTAELAYMQAVGAA